MHYYHDYFKTENPGYAAAALPSVVCRGRCLHGHAIALTCFIFCYVHQKKALCFIACGSHILIFSFGQAI